MWQLDKNPIVISQRVGLTVAGFKEEQQAIVTFRSNSKRISLEVKGFRKRTGIEIRLLGSS